MAGTKRALLTFCLIVLVSPSVETANSFAGLSESAFIDAARQQASETAPREWIDPATGHRILRLSDSPGSASLYFHQNQYTAEGDKMVFTTREGLSTINFETRKIEQIVEGRAGKIIVGKKTRQVFYMVSDTVYAANLDTKARRAIATRPELRAASGFAVNADETLLAGSCVEGGDVRPQANPPAEANLIPTNQESSLEARWLARRPMRLFTINVKSGEVRTFHPSTDWLNHVQFSPTDPTLLMFCHEGPWHKVDRIWTIRIDGSELRKVHTRTMEMEIAGHEFFSPDGKTIWYDLQTPKSQVFWLAGYELATGKLTKFKIEREHWSVHYNLSPDCKLFVGDGGGPRSVAAPGNGQWIYLLTPAGGTLSVEKLVDLSKHDYRLEPNASFTPDGKWIVFRSNMHGASHVYAVEVKKEKR
ncbi:MAG TPA: oligogalacturonate lyase family protein [Blastocatellia bacterium]|nr:oligogalacturonate lyase family protein [Blastocatellia bacterium]